jgi:hypothetical protein
MKQFKGVKNMSTSIYGGHEAKVYFIEEPTYGETPANPQMVSVGVVQEVEPTLNPNLIKVRGLGSRDLQFLRRGLRHVDLKIVYGLQNINFLQHVTTLNSLSVEVFYEKTSGVISLLHKGCRIHRLAVDVSAEETVKVTAELYGQNMVVGTAKVGASYGDYSTAPLAWYETYVKKGATVLERVTDYRFTIGNNLERIPVIRQTSGHLLKYLPERHRELSGELVCDFETKEELDEILNDSEFTLEFGLGDTHKAVFNGCKWDSGTLATRIEELVSQKLPFTAKTVTIS